MGRNGPNSELISYLEDKGRKHVDKGSTHMSYAIARAVRELKKCPLEITLQNLKEIRKNVKYVGDYMVGMIEAFLRFHGDEKDSEESTEPQAVAHQPSSQPLNYIAAKPPKKRARTSIQPAASNEHDSDKDQPAPQMRAKRRTTKEYEPRLRTATSALLQGLLDEEIKQGKLCAQITKSVLVTQAQKYADEPIIKEDVGGFEPGQKPSYYDGWSTMKATLIAKKLVEVSGSTQNRKYSLTDAGRTIAEKQRLQYAAFAENSTMPAAISPAKFTNLGTDAHDNTVVHGAASLVTRRLFGKAESNHVEPQPTEREQSRYEKLLLTCRNFGEIASSREMTVPHGLLAPSLGSEDEKIVSNLVEIHLLPWISAVQIVGRMQNSLAQSRRNLSDEEKIQRALVLYQLSMETIKDEPEQNSAPHDIFNQSVADIHVALPEERSELPEKPECIICRTLTEELKALTSSSPGVMLSPSASLIMVVDTREIHGRGRKTFSDEFASWSNEKGNQMKVIERALVTADILFLVSVKTPVMPTAVELVYGPIVERKAMGDFLSSIMSKRLDKQIHAMDSFKGPKILLLEGSTESLSEQQRNTVIKKLGSLATLHSIYPLMTRSIQHTFTILQALYEHLAMKLYRDLTQGTCICQSWVTYDVYCRNAQWSLSPTNQEFLAIMLQSVHGIGTDASDRLVRKFQTIRAMCDILGNKTEEELLALFRSPEYKELKLNTTVVASLAAIMKTE